MILDYTKVEVVDRESRFLLKRTNLGNRQILNRKHAVTNQIYSYERQRIEEGKGVFPNTFYQTYHIFFEKNIGFDLTDTHIARAYADNQNRILISFQQRNLKQWIKLDWDEAETSFIAMANQRLQIIPYPLPVNANVDDWIAHKGNAIKKILPSQDIMPVLSSRHNEDTFQDVAQHEIKESKLVGIHLYPDIKPIDFANLSRLRAINANLKPNDVCALFVGFNAMRRLAKLDSVNSSFAYSTFGIDIFSPYQMSQAQMKAMLRDKEKLKEYLEQFYDITQGGYSTNPDQQAWYEEGLIDLLKSKVTIDEALGKFQAIIWYSTWFEQQDFDTLNSKLLSKENIIEYITNSKSKWATFWSRYGANAVG